MDEQKKGPGWILFGILLVLVSFGGPLRLAANLAFSTDVLRGLGLLCGLVGMSYFYLQDFSRFRMRDGQD